MSQLHLAGGFSIRVSHSYSQIGLEKLSKNLRDWYAGWFLYSPCLAPQLACLEGLRADDASVPM